MRNFIKCPFPVKHHEHAENFIAVLPRTDPLDFDFPSLIFENPGLNFLQALELFVAEDAGCSKPLTEVNLQSVPTSLEGKMALLDQRFKVKSLKQGLKSAAKVDEEYFKKQLKAQKLVEEVQHVPAVELHMFPSDMDNIRSNWKALIVPRAKEVFGRHLFLCQSTAVDRPQCVAELPFEPLPFRLQTALGRWDPNLDLRRSSPNNFLLVAEVLLAGSLASLCCSVIVAIAAWAHKLKDDDPHTDDPLTVSATFLNETLPKKYHLAQHADCLEDLEQDGGQTIIAQQDPLDAG